MSQKGGQQNSPSPSGVTGDNQYDFAIISVCPSDWIVNV